MLSVFAAQSKASPTTLEFSGERLVNYMLRPGEGVSPANLLGRSGLDSFASLVNAPVLAMTVMGDNLYAACDAKLYKITPGGTATEVGPVPLRVRRMVSNGTQIAMVGDNGQYHVSDGSTVSRINVPALPGGVTDIAFMDQYFILAGSTGTRDDALTVSALLDGTSFDPTDIAFAESNPDGITAIVAIGSDLWVLGASTFEIFYNAGAADFPFLPRDIDGEVACLGPNATVRSNDTLFWVRQDGAVMMAAGYSPQNIAPPEIQQIIARNTVRQMLAMTDRGHDIIAIVLDGRPAVAFDLRTKLWHERSTGADFSQWSARSAVRWNGTDYIGTNNGSVCTLRETVFQDDGEVIAAQATMAPVDQGGEYFTINSLYANIRGGVGLTGRDPEVMLETSRDGRNWSDGKWRKLGPLGDYYRRAKWNGLGNFKRFQARLTITDPAPRDILGVQFV